jgi:Flp pilus assembly protein TadG
MMRRLQNGTTTIEFAIIGAVLMTIIFAIVEFGRALYVYNVLTESARRGARMAAVCPVGDPKPASVAIFDSGSGTSSMVPGLTTANVQIQYLDANGNVLANPSGSFNSINYVSASIVNFQMPLFIPVILPVLNMSGFTATLPRESLGIPRVGVVTAC